MLEQRIEHMEEEVGILKAEVKNTLVDIREHLFNTDIDAALDTDQIPGAIRFRPSDYNGTAQDIFKTENPQVSAPRETIMKDSEADNNLNYSYPIEQVSTQPQPDGQRNPEDARHNVDPNLMASLIRWVILTRKYIGHEELEVFMEICHISGGLPDGIRQLINRIGETVKEDLIIDEKTHPKWSDLMLQLHGIISTGSFIRESKLYSIET